MKLRQYVIAALVLFTPAAAFAGPGGLDLLRTGLVVEQGQSRLIASGVLSLEEGGSEAAVIGYGAGLAKNLDFEARVGLLDGAQSFGGGINYQALTIMADKPVDLSVGGGFSYMNYDGGNTKSVDVSVIASKPINEKLSWFGALTMGFANSSSDFDDELEEIFGEDFDTDNSSTAVHIVPGVQYQINEKLNFLAELGIGISDAAGNYLAGGIQYYFGR